MKRVFALLSALLLLCFVGCTSATQKPPWQMAMASSGYNWSCPNPLLTWGMTEDAALTALGIPQQGYQRVELAADGKGTRLDIGKSISLFGEAGFGNLQFSQDAGLFSVEILYGGNQALFREKLTTLLGQPTQQGDSGKGTSLVWEGTPLVELPPQRVLAYENYLRQVGIGEKSPQFMQGASLCFVALNIDPLSRYYGRLSINATHAAYLAKAEAKPTA